MIRLLGLEADDSDAEEEEALARVRAAEAALERLDELVAEGWVLEDTAERVRGGYRFRIDRFSARMDPDGDGKIEKRSLKYQRLRRELIDAERHAIVELRNAGEISDEVMRRDRARPRPRGLAARRIGAARPRARGTAYRTPEHRLPRGGRHRAGGSLGRLVSRGGQR